MSSGSLGKLLGNDAVKQILMWQVLGQILAPVIAPVAQQLVDEIYPVLPSVPTSPADLADQVVRNIVTEGQASDEAKKSGLNSERFGRLVKANGEPLGAMQLLEASRRQIISFHGKGPEVTSVEQGVAESHIKNKWLPVLEKLQWVPLPVADAAEAVVKGHLTQAQGAEYATYNGIKPDIFDILVKAAGNPPSPMELLQLYRRGDIPLNGKGADVISVEAGIAEGRTMNKWFPYIQKLAEYLPPPRTITALLREGSITAAQAQAYFTKAGLPADLANIYTHAGQKTKLAKQRDITESQTLAMYEAHVLTNEQAHEMLIALGYDETEAQELILYTDLKRELDALSRAIAKVGAQYLARKLSYADASTALDQFNLPSAQRDQLLHIWQQERAMMVKVLTEAQVASAFSEEIIDQQTAQTYLEGLGYSPYDAWVLLSVKKKQQLPNQPEQGQNAQDRSQ